MTKAQEASLIEAMTRAILKASVDAETWSAWSEGGIALSVQIMRPQGLAALRAMKEHGPTPAMVDAGNRARMNIQGGYGGPSSWEAMLEAAIAEAQP